MSNWILFWLCFCVIVALGLLSNIAGNIKRIADEMDKESTFKKGYNLGFEDAKRAFKKGR